MSLFDDILAASRAACPRIVLSEGADARVREAGIRAAKEGLAHLILIGSPDGMSLPFTPGLEAIDPATSEHHDRFAQTYFELRQHKGITLEQAQAKMRTPLGFAAMMVHLGEADGTIGGAVHTTGDTVRAALQIIGKAPGSAGVSSFFLMLLGAPHHRPVVFADCALVIEPSVKQLADIAISSARSFNVMTGETPRVAMLSFSTKGSARDESIDRINEALDLVKAQAPDLAVDGELQFDAAFVPEVGSRKAPESGVAGQANVFVFPNLNAANIGYKIAQRIGGAVALGPILQGLAAPANDLSRGCSTEDVYQMIAITGAQAAARRAKSKS